MITEIRASKLARPMVCAGFTSFENLPEQDTNDAAKEGTAAGEYLAKLLLSPGVSVKPEGQASNGVYFDSDMDFYLRPIADHIGERAQSQILCEQRIDFMTRSGIRIRGSYDASYVHNGNLYIDDLKYGWGIVEVKENWQLIAYAIGEVIRRQMVFPEIILRILQPRPHHEDGPIREWRLTYNQLLEYKERIEVRMELIASGFKELQTGKQCKYCAAAPEACPAFNRLFYRSLEVTTEFVQDSITDAELARQLDQVARAEDAIKIKSTSLKELAVNRIKGGKIVPGWMTETNYGDRKWKPGISPETIEVLTGKKIVEQKMLSPAQAEKIGVSKDLVNGLVDRHFLGQKLVRKDAGKLADNVFGKDKPKGDK